MARQPLGRTFVVAVSLLGIFAALQAVAVAWHFLPKFREMIASLPASQEPGSSEPAARPASAAPVQQSPPPPAATAASVQHAQRLLDEADSCIHVGNYEAALRKLLEAEKTLPGDPGVLIRKAQAHERLEQPAEAVVAIESALLVPGLPSRTRVELEKKRDLLARSVGSPSSSPATDAGTGRDVRDDVGLQPGSALGIVDCRIRDAKLDTKSLRIAVKSRPGASINVQDVKILVYFYEEGEDGEVVLTESKVVPQWLSPPIDWTANEPELLDVQYTPPSSDELPTRKYHGYTVGIYYNSELQDFRAEPGKLASDFPLPLYLKQSAE